MSHTSLLRSPVCLSSALLLALVAGCGGGGDNAPAAIPNNTTVPGTGTPTEPGTGTGGTGSTGGTTPTTPTTPTPPTTDGLPAPVAAASLMSMSCVDGTGYVCSGGSIIRSDNGIALTASGVQAYGRSTSDLAASNISMTGAFGLAPASGGIAELRVAKSASGNLTSSALLLRDLGLSWDGKVERPPIIETFRTELGRLQLAGNGALAAVALPPSSNLDFYDYATRGAAGTQANYANNIYFPRSVNPPRCDASMTVCPTTETTGLQVTSGDWRSGGDVPDMANAVRLHEDGDIHAGDGLPAANGSPTFLPGGTGFGAPFPGAKGYRELLNWSFQYANLATWLTQDTILIEEWAHLGNEHNKNRRGAVAFGPVSDNTAIPASGTAVYKGIVYGWYTANPAQDPSVFRGPATVSVDFSTRKVIVAFADTRTQDAAATLVPAVSQNSVVMGAANTNVANYFTGSANSGNLRGGLSGRYFGPVISSGTTGVGPAEIGGTLSMTDAATGATLLGGFIGRKQ